MLSQTRAALSFLGLFTLLLGLVYPLAMTAVAGLAFPAQATGSLVVRNGEAVGSALIGQAFAAPAYLHPRPSVAGAGYDGSASSGTNLGPTSAKLAERLRVDAAAMRAGTGSALLPADALTTSGSGLDPDISPAFAEIQVARIAAARGLAAEAVRRLIAQHTKGRTFGLLGEPRVGVLAVNLALDAAKPALAPAASPSTAPRPGAPTASVAGPAG